MILLDTSALIGSLTGAKQSAPDLRKFIKQGERTTSDRAVRMASRPGGERSWRRKRRCFPGNGRSRLAQEATVAAELYRSIRRPRGREVDLAIAACAIVRDAGLWTLNARDFGDIPGLRLAAIW